MSTYHNASQQPRPRQHLEAAGKLYPHAWRQVDEFRAGQGQGELPSWPEWCFLPLGGAYAIVSESLGVERLTPYMVGDVGRLAALAAWRVTQGIYRFDGALYEALVDTPVTGDLPCDVLYRLPEWCVYVETPGGRWLGEVLHGFFAHLEWDANDGHAELRLLLDAAGALIPIPIHLGSWGLREALCRMAERATINALGEGMAAPSSVSGRLLPHLEPLLSLLLYLCSTNAEIGDGSRQPGRPCPTKTKKGWRLFPAEQPASWNVGVRLGTALRAAYREAGEVAGGSHARPRPHIRRAHWHTYRIGKGRAESRLKWLPPIPVNVDDPGKMPATIRAVGWPNNSKA